jgi:predicted AlkP superfamily pyrophosphatase or phosphodiesterase
MLRFAIVFLFLTVWHSFATPDTNRHVILITIDGCAAFYFEDTKAPLRNVRKLAAEGVVASGMRVANPAVTWPNHTTLVTGVRASRHSVLVNALLLPDGKCGITREPERTQSELIAVPTVFDILYKKGFITAGINWPCTPGSKTLHFNFPDVQNQLRYTTPQLIEELQAEKILDDSSAEAFKNKTGPKRDEIWAKAACHVMRVHRPNFMLLHFLVSDSIQHQLGPQCPEAYEALGRIDQHIGDLLKTLDGIGLREKTSILITADHGFSRVHRLIVGATVLRKAGLLETADGKSRVQFVAGGGTAFIYLNSAATAQTDRKTVIELFAEHEGIDRIIEPRQFSKYGYPDPRKHHGMGDLVLVAKDGYGFSGLDMLRESVIPTRDGGIGVHGYLASNSKMNAIFVAAGPEIAHGKKIGLIDNVDVAPTVAHLLGERFKGTDGKVLKAILAKD